MTQSSEIFVLWPTVLLHLIFMLFHIPSTVQRNKSDLHVCIDTVPLLILICATIWMGNGYFSCAIYFALTCNDWAPQLFICSPLPANSHTHLRKLS